MGYSIKLTHEHLTRQMDLIPVSNLGVGIKIVGAGAIGSFAALQLAKMGFTNLEVWDHDTVSVENMSCQFYRFKDIGKPKVVALKELIHDFTNEEIVVHHEKWAPALGQSGILIVAVDCMDARRSIWDQIKSTQFGITHVIDPRMGAEDALMYTMIPWEEKDNKAYLKTLYSNEDAVQERCTAKATIYTANFVSALVAKAVKNIACEQPYPRVTQWSISKNQIQSWENSNGEFTSAITDHGINRTQVQANAQEVHIPF